MSFKENLKNKIRIERLAQKVSQSVGAPGASKKIDKQGMRELLVLSPFVLERSRDLELYVRKSDEKESQVLVLDNELPLYGKTSVGDVALRRSPELKEMVSIRNIIKILNDSDILVCKGRDALFYVRDRALESLDLRYDKKDIQEMADEGLRALVQADADHVVEILELFTEILRYDPVPAEVMVNDYIMYGASYVDSAGGKRFGPVVMYNKKTNVLRLIKHETSVAGPGPMELIPAVALDELDPDEEGVAVFHFLIDAVLTKKLPTVH
jgi:hypothetical protein